MLVSSNTLNNFDILSVFSKECSIMQRKMTFWFELGQEDLEENPSVHMDAKKTKTVWRFSFQVFPVPVHQIVYVTGEVSGILIPV